MIDADDRRHLILHLRISEDILDDIKEPKSPTKHDKSSSLLLVSPTASTPRCESEIDNKTSPLLVLLLVQNLSAPTH